MRLDREQERRDSAKRPLGQALEGRDAFERALGQARTRFRHFGARRRARRARRGHRGRERPLRSGGARTRTREPHGGCAGASDARSFSVIVQGSRGTKSSVGRAGRQQRARRAAREGEGSQEELHKRERRRREPHRRADRRSGQADRASSRSRRTPGSACPPAASRTTRPGSTRAGVSDFWTPGRHCRR